MVLTRSVTRPSLEPWLRYSSVPAASQCRSHARHQGFSTSALSERAHEGPEKMVAVIGGGLGGLASAYYVVKGLDPRTRQRTRIVVLEKSDEFGGWCKSVPIPLESITVAQSPAKVVFETGPRSIRPTGLLGWLTIEMAHDIGLTPDILTVPKTAPSARNRYLYTPSGLSVMPSSLTSALLSPVTTPLVRSVLPGILAEPFRPRSPLHDRPDGGDESVDAFFSRRFGPKLAENMVSAMIHGIYAGDSRRLSVRTLFPGLWEAERQSGSVIGAALGRTKKTKSMYRQRVEADNVEAEAVKQRVRDSNAQGQQLVSAMEKASVWGVRGGLAQLIQGLRNWLELEGVELRTHQHSFVQETDGQWQVQHGEGAMQPSHIITTVPSVLPQELRPKPIPSATVAVVNLAFAKPSDATIRLFPPGFGYLIPRSIPLAQNPHRALGILFDSDVMPGVDDSAQAGLIKCSVLLGGSYWLDESPPPSLSHDELVAAALETLRLHFPATQFPEPVLTLTNTHHDCIPQVPVDYHQDVREFAARLRNVRGVKLGVVGSGLASVGVNGAVKHAWEVGTSFARDLTDASGCRMGTELWT